MRNWLHIIGLWGAFICWTHCILAADGQAPLVAERQTNTGVVGEFQLPEIPRVAWSQKASDVNEGLCYEGVVYLLRESSQLGAYNAETGEELWKVKIGTDHTTGLACSGNPDFDYLAVSHYGGLALVERHSGALLWNQEVAQGLAGPAIVGMSIYAAGSDGKVYAFDLDTGKILWKHDYLHDAPPDPPGFDGNRARFSDNPARPCPIATDGRTIFFSVFDQCRVLAVDCETGTRRWAFQTQGWVLGTPAVAEEFVFIGSQDDFLYCINKQTGAEVWKFQTNARVEADPAVNDKFVYFGSCDANLYCLEKQTGKLVWKFQTEKRKKFGGPIYEQTLLTPSTVYLPVMAGLVYAIDANSGKQKWQFRPSADSEIDGSFTDGKRLFLLTRVNVDGAGEEAIYALGQ